MNKDRRARLWTRLVLWLVIPLLVSHVQATNPFVHQLFTNNMVLQRDSNDPVWGWTTAGNTVTVKVFDQNGALLQTRTAVGDAEGRWQVTVGPFGLVTGNAAYSMQISAPGQTTQTKTNVLIGDVWLCIGQSNIARGLSTIGVYNLSAEVADSANYPNIRHLAVPLISSNTTLQTIGGTSWSVAGTGTTANFSATGYFMAREIYKQQGVAIGLINAAWSGTEIKLWLDPDFVSTFADFSKSLYDQKGSATLNTYSGGYNGMIAPLAPFAIKAAIWYQGENNTSYPEQYSRLLPALISKYRSLFTQPYLPFLIVQLTNTDSYAGLRDAQLNTVKNDPNTRLITTIDIGENQLHPKNKQDVGLRASWAAASLVYQQNVVSQGPLFTGATVSGNTIRCSFSDVGAGLMVGSKTINTSGPQTPTQQVVAGTLAGFTIAGANQTYFAANAVIDSATNTVVVSSANVASPVYVRYAWANTTPAANLYNKITDINGTVIDGIPASPFRSPPVYLLNVNMGTGTGYYALNAQVPVTSSSLFGQTFTQWNGDTSLLSATNTSAVTATVAQTYVSVLANYQVTSAPRVVAVAAKTGQISLNWTAMTAVHYNVKRATALAGPYNTIAADLTGTPRFIDLTAAAGTTYYYAVSALNASGEGPDSAPVTVSIPSEQTNTVQVGLSWSAYEGAVNSYNVKRATQTGGPYTTISTGSAELFFIDSNVVSGTTYYYLVSAVNGGNETPLITELAIMPNFLPPPLQDVDIGMVGLTGGAFANTAGAYTVMGSGTGLGADFDSCNFAYLMTPVTGDFTFSAHIASLGASGSFPEAGVMIRSSLADTSPYARTYANSVNTSFQWRSPTNGNIGFSAGSNTNRWVRVIRTNNVCAGWVSTDGVTWTQQGGTIAISGPVYAGLMVTSISNTVNNTTVFDNVTLSPDWGLQTPAKPTGVNAAQATTTSILLDWKAAVGAVSYNVKRATASGGPYATIAAATNVLSYTNTGLTADTSYFYVISAINSIGESLNSIEVTTSQLAAPTNLTGAPLSETQIRLDWTSNAPSATSYEVQRSPAGTNTWANLSTNLPGSSVTYTDASLSPSTGYNFRVRCARASLFSNYATVNSSTPAGIGDGIPGAWRYQYFGNGLLLTTASALHANPDGDGQDNLAEYFAGTNPIDPTSYFRINSIVRNGNNFDVNFSSITGKTYTVEKTSDLTVLWSTLQANIAGNGSIVTISDPGAASQSLAFYRVKTN